MKIKYYLDKKELGLPLPPFTFSRNPREQAIVYPIMGILKWPSFLW